VLRRNRRDTLGSPWPGRSPFDSRHTCDRWTSPHRYCSLRKVGYPKDLPVGDILATPVTGAYGHSMGSNCDKVRRPVVVFCRAGTARLLVWRETADDLLQADVGRDAPGGIMTFPPS